MKTILKIALLAFLTGSICMGKFNSNIYAQSNSPVWKDAADGSFLVKGERRIIPQIYKTVEANYTLLKSSLSAAPYEFTERAINSPLVIELPLPNGGLSKFKVIEYSMMEPGLSAKYPEFKTYTVKGIDDPYAAGKIDITMTGFHAMILSPNGSFFIDPYSSEEKEIYISYFKKDFVSDKPFDCVVEENPNYDSKENNLMRGFFSSGPQLRSYRLGLAATGEYTAYFGGTKAQGMAAIVTSMNRINGVYEREMSVRMVLIANNDTLVYTNAATDPYSNNDGFAMLGQNQTTLDNIIGPANYDMGHVYSTGGGGVAYLACICQNGAKARGVTGLPSPVGDPFYIDYVAHEMGHQYGGNHSFNSEMGGCGGGNRNAGTAWEPGSGSTIMGYAGLCGGDNTQSFSDAYFQSGNFSEMVIFTQIGAGNSCPAITNTGDTPPVITMPLSGFTIPISTPFNLTGSATDPENPTSLTYCWEEMDLGPPGSPNNPTEDAPIIRSLNPNVSPTRTVPRISNLINNTNLYGERLPTYTRNLIFRLTVRDNSGGVDYDQVTFAATATAGPFLVTEPNTNVTWNTNNPQTVTWNVANTTDAPVSTAMVNIKLSTDGGNTFGTTLLENTPNDGSQIVTLPLLANTQARIKVESVGNIFFDISNANFTLTDVVSVQSNETGIPGEYALSQNFPNPFNPATKINFDLPYSSNVTLKIMDISGKEIATIVKGFYNAGSYNVTFSANEYGTGLASGIYFYKVIAESDKGNFVTTKKMTLIK